MKKRLLPALLALVMILAMLPMAVFAENEPADTNDTDVNYDEQIMPLDGTEITTSGGKLAAGTYTLSGDITLTAPIEIEASTEVVIDLNGHKITAPANKQAIIVAPQGKLEIKDSGTNGEITRTDNKNVYVILNNGEMTLTSGKISSAATNATTLANRSKDQTHGAKLTINGGSVTGDYIAIKNDRQVNNAAVPELFINSGIVAAGKDQVIQNWGNATITDGTFSGCVGTWTDGTLEIGKTTISGGTFDLEGSSITPAALLGLFQYTANTTGAAELEISGEIHVDNSLNGSNTVPVVAVLEPGADGKNQVVAEKPNSLTLTVNPAAGSTFTAPVDAQYLDASVGAQAEKDGVYTYYATVEEAQASGGLVAEIKDGEAVPVIGIKATGFIWDIKDSAAKAAVTAAGGTVGNDWDDQTMWIVFDQKLPNDTSYWFDVEINGATYGIAAVGTGEFSTYAFSFLNLGQWENPPTDIAEEGISPDALKNVTITVYKTNELLTQAPADTSALTQIGAPQTVEIPEKSTNANPNLDVNSVTTDIGIYAKVEVTGMQSGRKCIIRIASGPKLTDPQVNIVINGTDYQDGYTLYCQAGQTVTVYELKADADLSSITDKISMAEIADSAMSENATIKNQ